MEPWVSKLFQEKAPRYSRALLETLALIAYRQPITRSEIEQVRGVSVSSYIVKTLLEREWVRVVGHKEVPGRPAMYATTKEFLDYFNVKSLEELPTLSEVKDLDQLKLPESLSLPEIEQPKPDNEELLEVAKISDSESAQQSEKTLNPNVIEEPPEPVLSSLTTAELVEDELPENTSIH
jgi:segregation and condensation protein B